jgi:hypothetical protein
MAGLLGQPSGPEANVFVGIVAKLFAVVRAENPAVNGLKREIF